VTFHLIVYSLIAADLWWWQRTDARLARLRHSTLWRSLLAAFLFCALAFPVAALCFGHLPLAGLPAAGVLWHLLVLPVVVFAALLMDLFRVIVRRFRGPAPAASASAGLTRREFLTGLAASAPIFATGGLTVCGIDQIGKFRVRDFDLSFPTWPAGLDGFTMAVVADVHTGPFTTQRMLEEIVEKTNTIHNGGPADLVILGGDLINTSLRDLPQALDMATALRSRLGTYACMGNHDVMDDARKFVAGVERAGIPVLIEDIVELGPMIGPRFQLFGVDWIYGDQRLYNLLSGVASRRNPDLFPICLAHHPHAWDEGVRQGLPLVISGHTHGGQIMLTDRIGGGPLRFRYWSGLYQRDGSTLVVSNGVGNWFPLRINAPPEILKLTLRSSRLASMRSDQGQ
jgi:predicted MPP superfamily phosphohydrolase